jgi:hypothetical protein
VDATKPKAKHAPKEANRRTVIGPHAAAALRLLIFTGARLREILHQVGARRFRARTAVASDQQDRQENHRPERTSLGDPERAAQERRICHRWNVGR